METHAMSLIRSGYLAARRWGLLAVLFSALLAFSLLHPSVAAAQEVKQIKLTEKHMQGFIVVSEHMDCRPLRWTTAQRRFSASK
jgi:hypothetical protein